MFDLIVKGGIAVTPNGTEAVDIGLKDGRIAALGDLDAGKAEQTIEARGLHVLPGVIDSQVHFREPGAEHKEDLGTGTAGAALGGVTAIFDMPNTKPSTTTPEALADKLARARGRAWVDHAFYLGACAENVDQLGEWERLPGCAGVKLFMGSSTGTLLVDDAETLLRVLKGGSRRMAVHAEDEARLKERRPLVDVPSASPALHPVWRDEETALLATRRLLDQARTANRRVHVLHITTAEELESLAQYRDVASVEVTPQHLTLAAPDCYERLGTYAQMNPPIRDERHREALWAAVRQGLVDCLGSDHAPHSHEEKGQPYPRSPSGMPGVQTLVPLMLDHVNAGRLSLERFVDLTSAGPARLFNLVGKGRIALGYDGDLTLVDMKASRTITHQWIASRCGWTPFEGMSVTGWPMATLIRGRVVMYEGQLQGTPEGQPLRFAGC
ncbi:MAG: dihydroorotase [Alphaproteobacteria bacterium]|nr:dihydroorotase [Alphaproteobacteria bacterium]